MPFFPLYDTLAAINQFSGSTVIPSLSLPPGQLRNGSELWRREELRAAWITSTNAC